MASFSYPESCAYTPSDLTIFKMKVVEDLAALSDKKAVLAFLLERCGYAWTGLFWRHYYSCPGAQGKYPCLFVRVQIVNLWNPKAERCDQHVGPALWRLW